jgi:multiple sugar transport system permease protein
VAPRKRLAQVVWYTTGVLLAALFILPLLSAIMGSFMARSQLIQRPAGLLPSPLSMESWGRLFADGGLIGGILNSLQVAAGTVGLTVVLSTLAGYGFAKFKFRGSGLIFALMLGGMLIPFSVLLTPISVVLRALHLTNSLFGVMLVYAAYQLPFCTFIMRNSFAAIPLDIEEAAMMDGCGRFSAFTRISLPLVVPGVVTSVIFAFLNAWNEFLGALIILTDQSKFTLPILLQSMQIGRYGTVDWGILNTGVIVSMVPCLLIFFSLQRYYLQGIFSGVSR